MPDKYKATEAMSSNQKRGRAWKKKKDSKRSYSAPYEMTAKSFDEEMSLEDVKSLYKFLTKAEKKINKYNIDVDKLPTEDYLDFLDAGGNAGLAFSREVLKSENILKSWSQEITEEELNTPEKDNWDSVQVAKATNEEKRMATFLVLEPQDDDLTTNDLHEDWYDADTVEKSCHNFNKYCLKANLLHLIPTTCFEFLESYITKADMILGERFIKSGSWLATIYVDESELGEQVWEGIKSGYFNGLSIQCMGISESI